MTDTVGVDRSTASRYTSLLTDSPSRSLAVVPGVIVGRGEYRGLVTADAATCPIALPGVVVFSKLLAPLG